MKNHQLFATGASAFQLACQGCPIEPPSPGVPGSFFNKLWRGSAELVVKMGHRDIPKSIPSEENHETRC